MANSSNDWLTALLERSEPHGGGVKTLEWLPDFSEPRQGFVEGLPAGRVQKTAQPEFGVPKDDDPLIDLLREALDEKASEEVEGSDEQGESSSLGSDPDVEDELQCEPEPPIDPVTEAFEQGKAAGREDALLECETERQRKLAVRQTFRALDQAAMDALAGELAETVVALCAQTLADFIPAPDALKQRCLKAAQRLGPGAGEASLYLHPDDLALMDGKGLEGWKLVGDPAAERGGLRLETQDGLVSDRPEDWRRAIAAAVKG